MWLDHSSWHAVGRQYVHYILWCVNVHGVLNVHRVPEQRWEEKELESLESAQFMTAVRV